MTRRTGLRLAGIVLAVAWLVLFLRAETTDQSMVRAMLLEQDDTGWTVGLIYQFPEASADSSEASAAIRFCYAEGQTLAQALTAAEKQLPQRANYRLCDYLLFGADSTAETLRACEKLFLEQPYGRIASRVFSASFTSAEFGQRSAEEDTEALPEKLLQCLKSEASRSPRLYENRAGCLMPVIALDEDGAARADEGLLLTETAAIPLTEAQTEAALLLSGKGGNYSFWVEEQALIIDCSLCSVSMDGADFIVHLDCRRKAGSLAATQAQIESMEALCTETVSFFWENGVDLLRLCAVRSLRDGTETLTRKDACPQVQADVKIYGY